MRRILLTVSFVSYSFISFFAQDSLNKVNPKVKILYGTASYYANKFNGRKTATGEIFSQEKMTAACNVLPLGTWIKVTNLRNGRSVIVRTNDRLHSNVKRVVDLSRSAAQKLNYISSGLTKVKVEVIENKKPAK
jgi:rare lipoprotein A